MSKSKVLFKSEEHTDRDRVVTFLRALADKVEANQVLLQSGQQECALEIPQNLVLELKVDEKPKRQGKKLSLEVELEWLEGAHTKGPVSLG